MILGPLFGVIQREFKRVIRQRGRLVSTFARPLLWLIIIGTGFSVLVPGGEFSYHKYLLPGIIGMVVLFSSLLSALGCVHDREFGSMRMLMIAPVPRGVIVVGKAIAATLTGAVFALVLSPLMLLFNIHPSFSDYLAFLGGALLTGLALSSLGMLIAARIRRLENFTVAMNFVIFPMFFLSGALYPAEDLPVYLQPLVRVNPLTYGVDLMRHAMLAAEPETLSHIQFTPGTEIAYLLAFTIVALILASRLFDREDHLSLMFLASAPRIPLLKRPSRTRPLRAHPAARSSPRVASAAVNGRAGPVDPPTLNGHAGPAHPSLRGAVMGVTEREFKRVSRQRGRLISTFARPLLWMLTVGAGFAALIPGGQYHKYLLPGIIGMVILFSSLLSALGSVHDREFGPMRMLLVAPIRRGLVVMGKTVSSTLLGSAFAIVLSPLAWIFLVDMTPLDYLGFIGDVLLTALAISAFGMLIASFVRAMENFAVAMNFLIFPMFFFSGALYPAEQLPIYLQPVVRINPLTYGVDLMRHTMLAGLPDAVSPLQFSAATDLAFLLAFTLVSLILATHFFGREGHLTRMLLARAPRKISLRGMGDLKALRRALP